MFFVTFFWGVTQFVTKIYFLMKSFLLKNRSVFWEDSFPCIPTFHCPCLVPKGLQWNEDNLCFLTFLFICKNVQKRLFMLSKLSILLFRIVKSCFDCENQDNWNVSILIVKYFLWSNKYYLDVCSEIRLDWHTISLSQVHPPSPQSQVMMRQL